MKHAIAGVLLACLFFIILVRWLIIPSLIFHPVKEIATTPADIGLNYRGVCLQASNGEKIAAWYIPAAPDTAGPGYGRTLLFFHGNAGNISHRLDSIALFHKLGLSVFIIDYRGFGGSSGKPSVSGTLQDAQAAWQWLTEHKGVIPSHILIFGRSLGGGVAAALAPRVQPGAVILESTFTSLHAVGKDRFGWLPRCLFPEDYPTMNNLENLRIPLLVVHSPEDEVIPYRMGRELFENYNGPKKFLKIRGPHNEGWYTGRTAYQEGISDFLKSLSPESP